MKKINFKEYLKNQYVFTGINVFSILIIAGGIYYGYDIYEKRNSLSNLQNRIVQEERTLQRQQEEVSNIRSEYSNKEITEAIDINNRGHIIIQEIKNIANELDINVNFSSSNQSGRGNIDFTTNNLSIDPDSGLLMFEGNMSVNYVSYENFKYFINYIDEIFPLTIDSLSIGSNNIQIGFSLYGLDYQTGV